LGGVSAAGMAPLLAWPLTLVGLAGWLGLHLISTPRQAGFVAWWFGAAYFGASLHWLVEPFLVDLARHGWMAPFAVIFMAGGLALIWGLFMWLVVWLAGRFAPGRNGRASRAGWVLALGAAELTRAHLFTGFPWASPVQALIDTPMAAALAWIGPYGLMVAFAMMAALVQRAAAQRRLAALLAPAAVGGALSLAALAAPDTLHDTRSNTLAQTRPQAPLIRIVQPNAAQRDKWDPVKAPMFFQRALKLSAAAPKPDLVIWPESAVANWLSRAGPAFELMSAATGTPMITGINADAAGRAYNALVVLDDTGNPRLRYDKHHLVPFGEYIPLPGLLRALGLQTFTQASGYGFSAGPGPQVLDLGALGHALPLICYEAVFPHDLRTATRPDWVLQITNDAWFGNFAGPQQHLVQARMRAIETGLPLIRAANTGISALIDARGRVQAALPLNVAGRLDVRLPPPAPPTLYSRTGDLPVTVLLIVGIVTVTLRTRRESV